MSTQTQSPRPSSKTRAKQRAAARKRNRDFFRRFLAIFFVIIFALGTGYAALGLTSQAGVAPTDTPTPAVAQPTAQASQPVPSDLAKKGDEAMAQNKLNDALSYYQAASALNQSDAELHYKIGDLLVKLGNFDSAADQLARAVELDQNGPTGTKAKALMDENKDKLPTRVIGTGAPAPKGVITGTPAITDTGVITETGPITSANPAIVTATPTK